MQQNTNTSDNNQTNIIIVGGGPAGLSFAYHFLENNKNNNFKITIFEEQDDVGGISRTIYENGNGTDIGGHRFFTKDSIIVDFWEKLLPHQSYPAIDDKLLNRKCSFEPGGADPEKCDNVLLKRQRFSKIYYNNAFFDYPLSLSLSTFTKLGISQSFVVLFSYLKSCIFKRTEVSLEDFMINRFGKVLYEIFFKNYTTKVWGKSPSEISKEWGYQRIKNISLREVIYNLLTKKSKATSMISEYYYPKFGSSQLWQIMADEIKKQGGEIRLNSRVVSLNKDGNKIKSLKIQNTKTNEISEIEGDTIISTMPIKDLIEGMNEVPDEIVEIASNLEYRDFILVNFVLNHINLKNTTKYPTFNNITSDSWIYLNNKDIQAGRFNIMNHFSPYLVKNFKDELVCNLEYFCSETDDFWKKTDDEIMNIGISELEKLKFANKSNIIKSKVIRTKKAYPSYLGSYEHIKKVQDYLNTIENLYCIGRNGQHKYNNMDHSILSGFMLSDIIINKADKNTIWDINSKQEYYETK